MAVNAATFPVCRTQEVEPPAFRRQNTEQRHGQWTNANRQNSSNAGQHALWRIIFGCGSSFFFSSYLIFLSHDYDCTTSRDRPPWKLTQTHRTSNPPLPAPLLLLLRRSPQNLASGVGLSQWRTRRNRPRAAWRMTAASPSTTRSWHSKASTCCSTTDSRRATSSSGRTGMCATRLVAARRRNSCLALRLGSASAAGGACTLFPGRSVLLK